MGKKNRKNLQHQSVKENQNSVYSKNVSSIQEVDIIDNYTLRIILFATKG